MGEEIFDSKVMKEDVRELLERLHDKYNSIEFIEHDPISVPHSFTAQEDIEIGGFLAATIAWGNRTVIVRNAHRMMERMDNQPYDFTMNASGSELENLESFVHRTFNGGDFISFVKSLRHIGETHGGIGLLFEKEWQRTKDIRDGIATFRREFFAPQQHQKRTEKHLSSIERGSACKRLNMYLRWMVRKDERGVDFGLWDIPSSALYMPLDVHSGNMGRALGLLQRKQNDWRAVEEITEKLREFDPKDPVKYDFSLFGAGIDGFLKD